MKLLRTSNPINSKNPLNKDRIAWWLPLPYVFGSTQCIDLLNNVNGLMVNGTSWFQGFTNLGLKFIAASSQYVDFGNPQSLQFTGTKDYTIKIVFRLNSLPGTFTEYILFAKDNSTGGRAYTLDVNGTSGVRFYVNGGGSSANSINFGSPMSLGVDYVVHAVFGNDAIIRLYINGSLVATGTAATTTATATANVWMGRRPYSGAQEPLDGYIWEGGVWNRGLSASEVAEDYRQYLLGYPDLLNFYDFAKILPTLNVTAGGIKNISILSAVNVSAGSIYSNLIGSLSLKNSIFVSSSLNSNRLKRLSVNNSINVSSFFLNYRLRQLISKNLLAATTSSSTNRIRNLYSNSSINITNSSSFRRIRSLLLSSVLNVFNSFSLNRVRRQNVSGSIQINSRQVINRLRQLYSYTSLNINSSNILSLLGSLKMAGQAIVNSIVSITKSVVGGTFSSASLNLRRNISSLGQISNIQYPHPIAIATSPSDRRHIANIYRKNLVGSAPPSGGAKLVSFLMSLFITSLILTNRIRQLTANSNILVSSTSNIRRIRQINQNVSLNINSRQQLRRVGYCVSSNQINVLSSYSVRALRQIKQNSAINVFSSETINKSRILNFANKLLINSSSFLYRGRQISQNSSLNINSRESLVRNRLLGVVSDVVINSTNSFRRIGDIIATSLLSISSAFSFNGGHGPTVIISVYPFTLKISRMQNFALSVQTRKEFALQIKQRKFFNLHITKE